MDLKQKTRTQSKAEKEKRTNSKSVGQKTKVSNKK